MRLLTFLAALCCAAPALAQDADGGAPQDLGATVFEKRCAGCHGDDGKAQTRNGKKYDIADFTEPKWAKAWNRAQVKKTVRNGVKGQMPAWGEKLSPEEIDAVAAYVFKLAGQPNHK